jgi:hypothetical protein
MIIKLAGVLDTGNACFTGVIDTFRIYFAGIKYFKYLAMAHSIN